MYYVAGQCCDCLPLISLDGRPVPTLSYLGIRFSLFLSFFPGNLPENCGFKKPKAVVIKKNKNKN